MSLIADALKTAQRERRRRESQGEDDVIAAVMVPLRQPDEPAGRTRMVVIAVALAAVVVAGVLIVRRDRGRPLATASAITSTILSEALADSAPRAGAGRAAANAPRDTANRSSGPQRVRPVATAITQGSPRVADSTVPHSQPALDTAVVQAAAPGPQPGGLRIAVESSRSSNVGRLFSEAVAAHRAGDLTTARPLYEQVLALTPNDPDVLNNLGVLLSAQGDFDRALVLLRRAATLAPRSAGTWNNIGTALREQGSSDDAIAAFRSALAIDPQHQGARVGLAQQYLAIRSLDQARQLLEQVLAANPALPEAQYTLGQVLELQGDRAGAIAAYSTFVRIAPPRLASHADRVRQHLETLGGR